MRAGVWVALGLALGACGAPRTAWHPSEAMDRSARMLRQLDALEAGLHQGAEEIDTYSVLVARHAQAEQVSCKVTDEHVEEIHRLAVAQEEKIRARRHRRKLASAASSPRTLASR